MRTQNMMTRGIHPVARRMRETSECADLPVRIKGQNHCTRASWTSEDRPEQKCAALLGVQLPPKGHQLARQ